MAVHFIMLLVPTARIKGGFVYRLGIRTGVAEGEERVHGREKLQDFLRACLGDPRTSPHFEQLIMLICSDNECI
jgi:hypothetical protein